MSVRNVITPFRGREGASGGVESCCRSTVSFLVWFLHSSFYSGSIRYSFLILYSLSDRLRDTLDLFIVQHICIKLENQTNPPFLVTMQSSTPDSWFMISCFRVQRVQRVHLISSALLKSCTTMWSNQIILVCYPCMRSCLTMTIFSSPKSDLTVEYINYHLSIRTLHYICAIYYHPFHINPDPDSNPSQGPSPISVPTTTHYRLIQYNQSKIPSPMSITTHQPKSSIPIPYPSHSGLSEYLGRLAITCWWSFGCSGGDFNFPSWCWCSGWFRWC